MRTRSIRPLRYRHVAPVRELLLKVNASDNFRNLSAVPFYSTYYAFRRTPQAP